MTDPGQAWVVVSYHRDGLRYPRAGNEAEQDLVYWRNIAVNAATFRHVAGPHARFVVCSRDAPPARVAAVLDPLGVDVRHPVFAHGPPEGFYDRYAGSLYVFDAMAMLATESADDDVVAFVDPDVVWVDHPERLFTEARRGGIVALDLDIPAELELFEHSRIGQTALLRSIVGDEVALDAPIRHFGGELYAMTGATLRATWPVIDRVWAATLAAHHAGTAHYNTEEHVMNAVLTLIGETTDRAGAHLQRIRTLPDPMGSRARAIPGLAAWHLPIEKDKGILDVFDHLATGGRLAPVGPDHVRWMARRVGVAPRGVRWLADRIRQVRWAVARTRRGPTARYGV